jgi:pyruvate/2-oxoglutarate dehydrogenase complex dihydrolipoamide dehydrogenase (E3) component
MKKTQYDLVVIGSGPGGSVAAKTAARLGVRVVLVVQTKDELGSGAYSTSSVANKALLYASSQPHASWRTVKRHVQKCVTDANSSHEDADTYEAAGVDVLFGNAQLADKSRVLVGDVTLEAKRVIIATTFSEKLPSITGLKKAGYYMSDTLIAMDKLPKKIAIIGGGPVAVEMANVLANLGCGVTLIEHNPCLIRTFDEDAGRYVQEALAAKGVDVMTSTTIAKVSVRGKKKVLTVSYGGETYELKADAILVAAGKKVKLPKGLKKAEVLLNDELIEVNANWQTTNKKIYAIGDAAARALKQSHVAEAAAEQAVNHALYKLKPRQDLSQQPLALFCDPEVAQVGLPSHELMKRDISHHVYVLQYADIDAAVASDNTDGFIKVITDKNDAIISGIVVGAAATEVVGYIADAIRRKRTLSQVANLPVPYPTIVYGLKQLARQRSVMAISENKMHGVYRRMRQLLP